MVVGITMPHNNGIEVFAALTRTSVPRAAHAGWLGGHTDSFHHGGLLRFSVNEENMTLKLMLILSSSLLLGSTECWR